MENMSHSLTSEIDQGTIATENILRKLESHYAPPKLEDVLSARLHSIVQEIKQTSDKESELIEAASSYFIETDNRLGMTPLQKITEVYNLLGGQADQHVVEQHAAKLIKLALEQQLDNPPQYLSHGFDHTMNVLKYTESILGQNPEIIKVMTEKYGISPEVARFMLLNVTLFHDVGYPRVGNRSKSVHSLNGAQIVASSDMQNMYKSLLHVDNDELMQDFSKAILYHNADSQKQIFRSKIVCHSGELLLRDSSDIATIVELAHNSNLGHVKNIQVCDKELGENVNAELVKAGLESISIEVVASQQENNTPLFIGRSLDKDQIGDGKLGLEYRTVDLYKDPLQAVIRLADNMDLANDRFVGVQKDEAFKAIYHMYGDGRKPESKLLKRLEQGDQSAIHEVSAIMKEENPDVSELNDTTEAMNIWKTYLAEKILKEQFPDMSEDRKKEIWDQVQYLDTEQLKHWGGSDVIQEVILQGATLIVTVDSNKFQEFSEIPIIEKGKDSQGNDQIIRLNVGIYQIWRAQNSFQAIQFRENNKIRFLVKDTEGKIINIPGITQSYLD